MGVARSQVHAAQALQVVLGGPGVAPRRTLSVAYPLSDSKQEKTA